MGARARTGIESRKSVERAVNAAIVGEIQPGVARIAARNREGKGQRLLVGMHVEGTPVGSDPQTWVGFMNGDAAQVGPNGEPSPAGLGGSHPHLQLSLIGSAAKFDRRFPLEQTTAKKPFVALFDVVGI
jgi:hypothetical protein